MNYRHPSIRCRRAGAALAALVLLAPGPAAAHDDPPAGAEVERTIYLARAVLHGNQTDGRDTKAEILLRTTVEVAEHVTGEWTAVFENVNMNPPYDQSFVLVDAEREAPEHLAGRLLLYGHLECAPAADASVDIGAWESDSAGLGAVVELIGRAAGIGLDTAARLTEDVEAYGALLLGEAGAIFRAGMETVGTVEELLGRAAISPDDGLTGPVETGAFAITIEARQETVADSCTRPAPAAAAARLAQGQGLDPVLAELYRLQATGLDGLHPFTKNAAVARGRWLLLDRAVTRIALMDEEEPGLQPDLLAVQEALRSTVLALAALAFDTELAEAAAGGVAAEILTDARAARDAAVGAWENGDDTGALALLLEPFAALLALNHGEFVTAAPSLYIPVAAHTEGLNQTAWRTDVAVHSAGDQPAVYTIELLESGRANLTPRALTFTLGTEQSARYEDILAGIHEGTAALRITTAAGLVMASSRTYTVTGAGTFGQYVPALPTSAAILPNQEARLIQLSHSHDPATGFRTNLGLLNLSDQPSMVAIAGASISGNYWGDTAVTLAPYEHRQVNGIFERFEGFGDDDGGNPADGYLIISSFDQPYLAYASVVDNQSGDAFLVLPQVLPAADPPATP